MLPKFEAGRSLHCTLAALSRQAHVAAAAEDASAVAATEAAVNRTIGRLW